MIEQDDISRHAFCIVCQVTLFVSAYKCELEVLSLPHTLGVQVDEVGCGGMMRWDDEVG